MTALALAVVALLVPATARADDSEDGRGAPLVPATAHAADDPGNAAALASMDYIAGGSGLDALAPDGSGVDVALIDSGVAPVGGLAEPGRVIYGPDLSDEGRRGRYVNLDTFGHGTHLAGLIAGRDPVTGFAGVAPGARLVSVKVAGSDGDTSLAKVLSAIDWVRANRNANGLNIRVVNLSLGVEDSKGYRRDVLAWAVEQLWKDGIAVVAAAGNNGGGTSRLDMPAADPFVIATGASDTLDTADPADDHVADFSSSGRVRTPDLVAPGARMVSLRVPGSALDREYPSARVGDRYFRGSGTSQAAAVLSGLAARLLSARPELTPDQLKALLVGGAVDLPEPRDADGAGRVDLARSLAAEIPQAEAVRQRWLPALVTQRALAKAMRDDSDHFEPGAQWTGRRWSGRRWSGRRWSGASWINDSDD